MRTHINFAALSLALPWGLSSKIDDLMRCDLGLWPPCLPMSLALRGEDGLIRYLSFGFNRSCSALLICSAQHSSASSSEGRGAVVYISKLFCRLWCVPSSLSSRIFVSLILYLSFLSLSVFVVSLSLIPPPSGLSAASIATVLLPARPQVCSFILCHVCANAPHELPNFCEPSLPLLSLYWRDSCDELMQSARYECYQSSDCR